MDDSKDSSAKTLQSSQVLACVGDLASICTISEARLVFAARLQLQDIQ